MSSLTAAQKGFYKLVDIATDVLSFSVRVVVARGILGTPKPTNLQVGYCYGFAEEMADIQLGVDDVERAVFVQLVFGNLFGRIGSRLISNLVEDQERYRDGLQRGMHAYREWNEGRLRTPLVPRD